MKVVTINTPGFRLDGGAMFGVVPKTLWSKRVEPDEQNRIRMITRALYLEIEGAKILVDVGAGDGYPPRFARNYELDTAAPSLVERLAELNAVPEDITHVILTHLHFDHCGAVTTCTADGTWVPVFPNARHYVQKRTLAWARDGSPRDRASFFPERFEPIAEAGLFELLDGPTRLFDRLELLVFDGHTQGLQTPLIDLDDGRRLFVPSDLIPMLPHVSLPWVMAFDLDPVKTIEEKQAVLGRAVDEGWLMLMQHDPACGIARVERTEKGFAGTEIPDPPFAID